MATVIKAVKKFVRNDVETPWYTPSPVAEDYIEKTYVETGYRLSREQSVSDDGLTLITTTTWRDSMVYDKFFADSVLRELLYLPRKIYNDDRGIKDIKVILSEETI